MTGLRRHVRNLVYKHAGGTALVLIYHRVAVPERDPQLLAVSPRNFDAQMSLLAEKHRVVPLSALIDAVRARKVPDRAVAVTFDDGYADNLLEAAPLLERHGIPATVFVSSGYVDTQREFWWDEVERLVLGHGTIAPEIALQVGAGTFSRTFDAPLHRSTADAEHDRSWNVLAADTDPRHRLYRDLCSFIRPLSAADRSHALEQLSATVTGTPPARATDRPLTSVEVASLDASPLVAVGAHTVSHPVLSALPVAEQRSEILCDKTSLEAICGRALATFSYPFGGLSDYTDETVRIVTDAGFSGACSNHPGVVKPWTDPYRLPRNLVRDWDAETFSAKMRGWFDDPR